MDDRLTLPRLAWHSLPYFTSPQGRSRPPLTIYWAVNSVCNLACQMCDVGQVNQNSNFYRNLRIDGKPHEIAPQIFKRVIDEVATFKPMISITSTEPLLYVPLAEIIQYTRTKGLNIAVTTNAFLLPQQARRLAEAGLSRLNVSIDAAPELHNSIRGRPKSFERAVEGIQIFHEATRELNQKTRILINCTISNLNYHALADFYGLVCHLPVDAIIFSYMNFVTDEMADFHNQAWGKQLHATPNCVNQFTQPARVDVGVLAQQIQKVKELDEKNNLVVFLPELNRQQLSKYFLRPMEFLFDSRCMVNWFIAEIIATGEIIPYTRCYYVPMGNINEQAFMEIWNGEKARQWRQLLREQHRFPACTRCDQIY